MNRRFETTRKSHSGMINIFTYKTGDIVLATAFGSGSLFDSQLAFTRKMLAKDTLQLPRFESLNFFD